MVIEYASIIDNFMYAIGYTKSDIVYVVGLCMFTIEYCHTIEKVLRYFKMIVNAMLCYQKISAAIEAYNNVDGHTWLDDFKEISGYRRLLEV